MDVDRRPPGPPRLDWDDPAQRRCAYMMCHARPSRAEIERVAAEAAVARSMRIDIDYAAAARRRSQAPPADDTL